MNEVVGSQTLLFITSIQIGILLAVVYDLIRIFRKAIPHTNWMVHLEDITFWVLSIGIGFGVLYVHNYGEMRLFVFLGMILGAIFYLLTLSILFMKIATYIIDQVKKLIMVIVRLLSIPIKWIVSLLKVPLRALRRYNKTLNQYSQVKRREIRQKQYYNQSDKKVERRIKEYRKSSR